MVTGKYNIFIVSQYINLGKNNENIDVFRWLVNNCENTKYVLKTDDDQAVDIFHLPTYLEHYTDQGDLSKGIGNKTVKK